jgi:hypothetical protein
MKQILACLFVLAIVSSCSAISIQEIVQLSKLNTSEELLLDLIHRTKLDHAVTLQEVVLLKEAGVKERVIQYLVKLSHPDTVRLPESEGESVWISDNMRVYQTRDKEGKIIKVVTNLDENGERVGGEVPPTPPPQPEERYPEYVSEEPREIYVTVRHEDSRDPGRDYDSTDYSNPYYGGIPIYYGGYYPGTFWSPVHCNFRPPMNWNGNSAAWQGRAHPTQIRPSIPTAKRSSIPAGFAGTRPVQIHH